MTPKMPHPFASLGKDKSTPFEAELARELKPGHPLFGIPVSAIGRRFDQDEFLFALLDGTGRVAEVHLTLAGERERPPWPSTVLFDGFDAWADAVRGEFGQAES